MHLNLIRNNFGEAWAARAPEDPVGPAALTKTFSFRNIHECGTSFRKYFPHTRSELGSFSELFDFPLQIFATNDQKMQISSDIRFFSPGSLLIKDFSLCRNAWEKWQNSSPSSLLVKSRFKHELSLSACGTLVSFVIRFRSGGIYRDGPSPRRTPKAPVRTVSRKGEICPGRLLRIPSPQSSPHSQTRKTRLRQLNWSLKIRTQTTEIKTWRNSNPKTRTVLTLNPP